VLIAQVVEQLNQLGDENDDEVPALLAIIVADW
jgi:hypothetical protein